jgi:hypothetical protein
MNTRTYTISTKPIVSAFYKTKSKLLRDLPEGVKPPAQNLYLNEVMGFFMRTLIKVYGTTELTDKDKANLKRYLDKVIEAKDAIDGKTPEGRIY